MAVQVVSYNCILKTSLGRIISCTANRDVIASLSEKNHSIRLVAEALCTLKKGERKTIHVSAADAYGFYKPELALERNRTDLIGGDELKAGEVIRYLRDGELKTFRVVDANSISVILDGNHPLAGLDLVYEIEALERREAYPDEITEATPQMTH